MLFRKVFAGGGSKGDSGRRQTSSGSGKAPRQTKGSSSGNAPKPSKGARKTIKAPRSNRKLTPNK